MRTSLSLLATDLCWYLVFGMCRCPCARTKGRTPCCSSCGSLRRSRDAEEIVGDSERRAWEQAIGSSYDMAKCKMRRFLQHNTLRLLRDLMTVCKCVCVCGGGLTPPTADLHACIVPCSRARPALGRWVLHPHRYHRYSYRCGASLPHHARHSPWGMPLTLHRAS